jgi:hypothetical protein
MGFIVYLLFDAAMVLYGENEGILGHVEGVRFDGILKSLQKAFLLIPRRRQH